jgi:hypothetical protein
MSSILFKWKCEILDALVNSIMNRVFKFVNHFLTPDVTCSGTGDAVRFVNLFYYDDISRHYNFFYNVSLFVVAGKHYFSRCLGIPSLD